MPQTQAIIKTKLSPDPFQDSKRADSKENSFTIKCSATVRALLSEKKLELAVDEASYTINQIVNLLNKIDAFEKDHENELTKNLPLKLALEEYRLNILYGLLGIDQPEPDPEVSKSSLIFYVILSFLGLALTGLEGFVDNYSVASVMFFIPGIVAIIVSGILGILSSLLYYYQDLDDMKDTLGVSSFNKDEMLQLVLLYKKQLEAADKFSSAIRDGLFIQNTDPEKWKCYRFIANQYFFHLRGIPPKSAPSSMDEFIKILFFYTATISSSITGGTCGYFFAINFIYYIPVPDPVGLAITVACSIIGFTLVVCKYKQIAKTINKSQDLVTKLMDDINIFTQNPYHKPEHLENLEKNFDSTPYSSSSRPKEHKDLSNQASLLNKPDKNQSLKRSRSFPDVRHLCQFGLHPFTCNPAPATSQLLSRTPPQPS